VGLVAHADISEATRKRINKRLVVVINVTALNTSYLEQFYQNLKGFFS
jgi:hypothetical protein